MLRYDDNTTKTQSQKLNNPQVPVKKDHSSQSQSWLEILQVELAAMILQPEPPAAPKPLAQAKPQKNGKAPAEPKDPDQAEGKIQSRKMRMGKKKESKRLHYTTREDLQIQDPTLTQEEEVVVVEEVTTIRHHKDPYNQDEGWRKKTRSLNLAISLQE